MKKKEKNLALRFPHLIKEWNLTKNGDLTPYDVTYGSGAKVWWKCDRGHEWQAIISNRTGRSNSNNCPYCVGKKVCIENSLATLRPEIAEAWHPTKNGNLTPYDVTCGSNKKVWWRCNKGHEWETSVYDRCRVKQCPYCSGRRPTQENCLATLRPEIAEKWHPTKNGDLTPYDVTCGSNKKLWWRCNKGHEWESSVSDRCRVKQCPYCSGRRPTQENCLATLRPEIAAEWHPTKNGDLTPYDVLCLSNKKVWWRCQQGHEWHVNINSRVSGSTSCPYCAGRKVCIENCLAIVRPEIAAEWHPTKNEDLTPYDVTYGSNKKVWWVCEKGHEWHVNISSRVSGSTSCPYCAGRKVCIENCLAMVRPEIAAGWHPTKNEDLTPYDVTYGSKRLVWWRCNKGHEWEMKICGRTRGGGGKCPYCQGKRVCAENCLSTLKPEIAAEWHPTKNGNLTPCDVTCFSDKKVWWKCECGYEWKAMISNRSKEPTNRCKKCSARTISLPQKIVIYYISNVFDDVESSYRFNDENQNYEIDCYIPSLRLGIEYDGYYYHKNNKMKDEWKNNQLRELKIDLIRIREIDNDKRLPDINMYQHYSMSYHHKDRSYMDMGAAIQEIYQYIINNYKSSLNKKQIKLLDRKDINIKRDFSEIQKSYNTNRKEDILAYRSPYLIEEWHEAKNGKLTPYDITYGSAYKAWWKCKRGHEWQAAIYSRTKGNNCPYCAGRKVCIENCLATLRPEIAAEWHPTKNGDLTPYDVTSSASKKVWWRCVHGHEWETSVNTRSSGHKCKICVNNNRRSGE